MFYESWSRGAAFEGSWVSSRTLLRQIGQHLDGNTSLALTEELSKVFKHLPNVAQARLLRLET